MDGWIVIPNWNTHQHYKDRDPTWIKVYTELNSRDEWLSLTCSARGLLTTCWLEYARSRGRARLSHVASIAGAGFKHSYFQPLIDAGFIEVSASAPPAFAASPEKEKRREEKALDATPEKPTATTPAERTTKPVENRTPFSAPTPGRVNMPASDPIRYVEALIRNGVITDPQDLEGYDLDDTTLHQLKVRLGG